ncbi:hypothetical protein NFI96_010477, partial [Prochilodus magdalenae]
DMNDFGGPECSYQRDLSRGAFVPPSQCHLEFVPAPLQLRQDRAPPYSTHQDGPGYPGAGESLRDDDFNGYRFYCPVSCDPSPALAQYSSVQYPDYLMHPAGPYHFLSPPPGLSKNLTPEEAYQYGMSAAEVREAVASISLEGADELCKQACSRHEPAAELRQCNHLDMGQNSSPSLTVLMPPRDPPRERLPVQTANMCQVVCNVNGGGQMVVLNHCSPNQIIHPMVLDHRVSSADPLLHTANHPHSPEHRLTQGQGDAVPVSQVLGRFPSSSYPSSFTSSNNYPSSSHISTAPSSTFNIMPGSYVSQNTCPARAETAGTGPGGAQSVRYCDCFANGEVCSSCNCINCCNNMEHEPERYRAIKICLERNPEAFRPKIGNRMLGDVKNRHTKGCNCKRSGCLKNYCECYEARIMCSSICKCVGCRNYDGSPVRECIAWQSPDTTHSPHNTSLHNSRCSVGLWAAHLSSSTPNSSVHVFMDLDRDTVMLEQERVLPKP